MHSTPKLFRYVHFYKPRHRIPLAYTPIRTIFPLLYSNNLLPKFRKAVSDFRGREAFDEQHALPIVSNNSLEQSTQEKAREFEFFLNPQLISSYRDLKATPDYVGPRSGFLFPQTGWHRPGANWKECKTWSIMRRGPLIGEWQERRITPRFLLAPRVCPGGPRNAYEGKLKYSIVSLARLVWAVESGRLNPNEIITLHALVHRGVVRASAATWPGVKLVTGGMTSLSIPLRLELQRATRSAVELVEKAGGQFVSTYYTPLGLHQELYPERYPSFLESELPERQGYEKIYSQAEKRGFLASWAQQEAPYAHPLSGRRLAHYVQPPTPRDFPATFEEYEEVKHQQRWHLFQAGTGTALPWHSLMQTDLQRTPSGKL